MKKTILTIIVAMFTTITFCQIPGSKIKGPVKISGVEFKEGDTLKIGTGTNPNGDFKFIYTPANYLLGTPQASLGKMYANAHIVIKSFKEYENKRIGKKTYTIVNFGGLNTVVEMESAIQAGEIIVNGGISAVESKPVGSVADELLKFKKLLDDGLITKEEFDAQKKKLLGT